MKILHVITSLQKAAGTSVFVAELSNELVSGGHEVSIAVSDPNARDIYPINTRIKLTGVNALEGNNYDIVHIHALWAPMLHRISQWSHRNHVPVVWSPHGMLQKWALKNKWLKKMSALLMYQWLDLKKATLLHATAQAEVEDIRRLRLDNKIVLAPLGVRVERSRSEVVKKSGNARIVGKRTILFVSRVQRKKGLPVLIEAWAKLPKDIRTGWTVRVVGPDQDNHTAELLAQCQRLGVTDDFVFVGPKYGEELDGEYRSADLFVLPTHSENFGSVVIEALARGIPVICSQGAPWKALEDYGCGWWPEDSVTALFKTLKSAMCSSDDELHEMGTRGQWFVEEKYTWGAVMRTMLKEYGSLLITASR